MRQTGVMDGQENPLPTIMAKKFYEVHAARPFYGELVEFANSHAMLRAWAIEGTGGHGAGLTIRGADRLGARRG